MGLFDGFIAGIDCTVGLEALRDHPNVKCVTRLPRQWVLYEFHDELFKDPDFLVGAVWRDKMQRFPEVRQKRIEMLNQQRALLAPWYAKKKKLGDADGLLANEICEYRISSLHPMKWIDFKPESGWGTASQFSLDLEFDGAKRNREELTNLLEEWTAAADGMILLNGGPRWSDSSSTMQLQAKCKDRSGHWIAALCVLLSDARIQTGTRKMSVLLGQHEGD